MECPHCKEQIKGMHIAMSNLENYNPNGSALVLTQCCKKPVTLYAKMVYSVSIYAGNKTRDDWGNPIKKDKV